MMPAGQRSSILLWIHSFGDFGAGLLGAGFQLTAAGSPNPLIQIVPPKIQRPSICSAIGPIHRPRKRPNRPFDHPASAMPPRTKTIPAVSSEATPANSQRQPRHFTSVQAVPPGPRKAPPPSRPCGPPAMPPSRRPAVRQRTVRPAHRRRRPPRPVAQRHREPPETAHPAARAVSTFLAARWDPQALSVLR